MQVLSTSSGRDQVIDARENMGGGRPTLTSGAHSPGENMHALMCTHTHNSKPHWSVEGGMQSWETTRQRK